MNDRLSSPDARCVSALSTPTLQRAAESSWEVGMIVVILPGARNDMMEDWGPEYWRGRGFDVAEIYRYGGTVGTIIEMLPDFAKVSTCYGNIATLAYGRDFQLADDPRNKRFAREED